MWRLMRRFLVSLLLALLAGLAVGCNDEAPVAAETPSFARAHIDRSVSPPSAFPIASDVQRVGTYPPETKSGAGFFYDDVLEYRVWLHPECGAEKLNGTTDYFFAFAQYEKAEAFSRGAEGAELP